MIIDYHYRRARYGSLDSEWSNNTSMSNTLGNDDLPFDCANADLLTPVSCNVRKKSQRHCSTPARLDEARDFKGGALTFGCSAGEPPESPKNLTSSAAVKQATDSDKMTENLTVVGLEVPFIGQPILMTTKFLW